MPSSIKSRRQREPSAVLVQAAHRPKNYSSRADDAAKPAIQAPAHECTAQETRAALPLRRGRATRKMETRSNTRQPPADNQTHNLAVRFRRTTRAPQSEESPLQATPQVPTLRPCRFRKARGR